MKRVKNVIELIGETPMLEIDEYEAKIFAKLESFNPASCVKERIALKMIEDALQTGRIDYNTTLIEPTSGNTGIGLAMVAASKKMKLMLTMPENMSKERIEILELLGADIVLTEKSRGMSGAIEVAKDLQKQINNSVIFNQFENPSNPSAHYNTTAPEIIEQLGEDNCDIFVAGIGTGGTLSGCGRKLKEHYKNVKVFGVEPYESAVISGEAAAAHTIQGIGAGFIPENLNLEVMDEIIKVKGEHAIKTLRECARDRGLLVGISSGAALYAAIELAKKEENRGKNIVVILPDSAERYLSMLTTK